jgi:hypothetical protein
MGTRQTGKSARIIDFVIDQLFSIGEVIITDHPVFEYPDVDHSKYLNDFAEKVTKRFANVNAKPVKLEWEILTVNRFKIIHFKVK